MRTIQRVVYAIPGYKWVAAHSHLVNLFRKVATILDDRARMTAAASLNKLPADGSADTSFQKVQLTVRLIEEFSRQARLHGGNFLLLNLPEARAKGCIILQLQRTHPTSRAEMRPAASNPAAETDSNFGPGTGLFYAP
jgi:hypothetical protein